MRGPLKYPATDKLGLVKSASEGKDLLQMSHPITMNDNEMNVHEKIGLSMKNVTRYGHDVVPVRREIPGILFTDQQIHVLNRRGDGGGCVWWMSSSVPLGYTEYRRYLTGHAMMCF
ncbi:hypothetical protein CEXT_453231 [Caerostris extrusa]|uniref:Uncharacterized protein n=1 Tax=Caerostris extrusa TaxID=172846 RepID=A0AAV4MR95_CAEEX|nr:hypothetical protein CEXT_453231 [Caerostris extrusa]